MMIQMLSARSFSRLLLFASIALAAPPAIATARETYREYADRITAAPPDGTAGRADLAAAVLRATNAYRASKGLKALKPGDDVLQHAAEAQALDLLSQNTMGHVSATGHDFAARMHALHPGQMFLPVMAENAARLRKSKLSDAEKAQALVQQWIKSPEHRKSMTDLSYTTVAIGVAVHGGDTYAVQIFSGPQVKTNMGGALQ